MIYHKREFWLGVQLIKITGMNQYPLTLVLRTIFPEPIFRWGLLQPPLIINMEGNITLNLLPLYSYGCLLSIDTTMSTIK